MRGPAESPATGRVWRPCGRAFRLRHSKCLRPGYGADVMYAPPWRRGWRVNSDLRLAGRHRIRFQSALGLLFKTNTSGLALLTRIFEGQLMPAQISRGI